MRKKARQLGCIKKQLAAETVTGTKTYTLDQPYTMLFIELATQGWGNTIAIRGEGTNSDSTYPVIPGGSGAAQFAVQVSFTASTRKLVFKPWTGGTWSGSYYIRVFGIII